MYHSPMNGTSKTKKGVWGVAPVFIFQKITHFVIFSRFAPSPLLLFIIVCMGFLV